MSLVCKWISKSVLCYAKESRGLTGKLSGDTKGSTVFYFNILSCSYSRAKFFNVLIDDPHHPSCMPRALRHRTEWPGRKQNRAILPE